jgi:hypothetical protein
MVYALIRKRIDDLAVRRRVRPGGRAARTSQDQFLTAFRMDPGDESGQKPWARAGRILSALKEDAHSDGASLAVVLIPAPWQLSERRWDLWLEWMELDRLIYGRPAPQARIMDWCARTETQCLDLTQELQQDEGADYYFRSDRHWTPLGHLVAARAVKGFVDSHRLQ